MIIGIDLAWTTDLTAMTCLFPPLTPEDTWKALMFFWAPDGKVDEIARRTRMNLRLWIQQGFMTCVPGAAMDVRLIEEKVKWAAGIFEVAEVTFDPYGMLQIGGNLVDAGYTCVSVRQGYLSFSVPTKKFLELYANKKLEHCNNPILNWNASCLALMSDGADNIKPAKPERDKSTKRIDGCSAIITALSRAMVLADELSSPSLGMIIL